MHTCSQDKERGRRVNRNSAEIWTIGGGKGGTGKTFVTSAFGTQLAKTGNSVTLIDVDIGAANLHSFLGIKQPKKSLTSFFEGKASLADLKVKAGITNMDFIAGDLQSLASDDVRYSQKLKLFRHIKNLKTRYVLIDIGAGSHKNIIDTFLIANKMIAVLLPETLAVENLYHFIKNALFRKMKAALKPYGYKEFVDQVWKTRERYKIKNLWELMAWLRNNFAFIGDILDQEQANFKIYIIMNQVKNQQDIAMGTFIRSAFKKFLNLDTYYIGYIEYTPDITKSISNGRPFMLQYSASSCAQEIQTCLGNLIEGKETQLPKI